MRFPVPSLRPANLRETTLLAYVFYVAASVHGLMVLSAASETTWGSFYLWELVGFIVALTGIGLWHRGPARWRPWLLLGPVVFCFLRWSVSWTLEDADEIYTTTVSVLMYFPVLVGCATLVGARRRYGLVSSAVLAVFAIYGTHRVDIVGTAVDEWRISPAILGVFVLYSAFFVAWRLDLQALQTTQQREDALNRELRTTWAQQLESRMKAVSQISGEVAHEFNNALNIIHPVCEILLEDLEGSKSVEDVHAILNAVQRVRRLSDELTSLTQTSRVLGRSTCILELAEAVEKHSKSTGRAIRSSVHVGLELPSLHVAGSRRDLLQLVDLLEGTLHELNPSARLTARIEVMSPSAVTPPLERIDGDDVMVMTIAHEAACSPNEPVALDGRRFIAMSPNRDRQLTKAYAIVSRSGGIIRAEMSGPSCVSFRVYLPAFHESQMPSADERPQTQSGAKAPFRGSQSGPRILLVEDDVDVLSVLQRGLRRRGVSFVVAESGEEALGVLRETPAEFDLLVCDVRMPGLSGPEVAERAKLSGLEIPTLFITGHIDDEVASRFAISSDRLLLKPFTLQEMYERICMLTACSE